MKIIYSSIFIFLIYVLPMIISYERLGVIIYGDYYQMEYSYIKGFNDIYSHIYSNIFNYLNIFNNKIFWFFVSALISQKFIKWIFTFD